MVGYVEDLSNWPTSDPDCAKTGPNTPPDFLYIIRYMFELTKNHSLMSQLFFAPRLNWAQSWWILKRSEICEISNFLNFAKPRQIIESA